VVPLPPQAGWEGQLERLKVRLLAAHLRARPYLAAQLTRAAAEAAALAWVTRFPLLLFPSLFEEMAEAAVARAQRQERIRQRSRLLMAA
jgi:hypothetical protein